MPKGKRTPSVLVKKRVIFHRGKMLLTRLQVTVNQNVFSIQRYTSDLELGCLTEDSERPLKNPSLHWPPKGLPGLDE